MAKSGEMHWLDAIEKAEEGDIDAALYSAKQAVSSDPKHSDAWMGIARWSMPRPTRGKPTMPSLLQASKSYAALKKVVNLEPENKDAWIMGGSILVDHLGMMEDALRWWEDYRDVDPTDVVPLIEQIAILVRLGQYKECAHRLEDLYSPEMDAPTNEQTMRMEGVRRMVERAAKLEDDQIFQPQNPKHPRWKEITLRKRMKPISSTFWLLTVIAPIVFIIGTLAMIVVGNTILGSLLVFFLILAMFGILTRSTLGMLHKRNRHALDIDRAIDYETTTGQVCISDELRESAVYSAMIKNRSDGVKERLEAIIASKEKINPKYVIQLPEWHFFEENITEDQESEGELEPLDD